jgi:tol-pal system protein YbgF
MIRRFALRSGFTVLFALFLSASAPSYGRAQGYNQPIYDEPPTDERSEPPPRGSASSGVELRVERLERELRQMTGRVEELQHTVQVLEEQLRTHSAATPPTAPPLPPPAGERRGDAFDPTANPSAVGAPRPIGQTSPSAPLAGPPRERDGGAPLDVTPGLKNSAASAPPPLQSVEAAPPAPPSMKDEYDQAVALMRNGQYEAAEKNLSVFLAKYSKSKYAPAATYGLGESFFLRGRNREAAEKYLEITTKYPQSAQAPDALLRLGEALAALGAHEQACASFSEIGVKYPGSPARIRDAAQRASKKQQCS